MADSPPDPSQGLSRAEAAARLAREGYNELPRAPKRSFARIVREVLREPMFQLLLAACVVYLLLGDLAEALLLLGFASGSVIISIVQEVRTESALEALRDLASPRALVIRDGRQQRIAGRELVRDDLVLLAEGDRVPADLQLLSERELQVDESLLTGESVAVRKRRLAPATALPEVRPGGDDLPFVFAGTLVVRGEGLGRVYATGLDSELGKIGRLLSAVREPPSPLHRQTRHIVHVMAGVELQALNDAALRERVRTVSVFARVVPQQKLRIVEALKANGEIVAMTGDGVNDAPSLKAAHIGVAMGGRGTDVAREAASLVLLDDDFGSLAAAVRQGRRIFDNLRKAMCYIVAVHVPVAGLALLPLLLGWPLILAPVHIVFLEMVIDPVCSIVFEAEPEEADIMHRPPRDPRQALLSRRLVAWSLLQGTAVLAAVTLLFVGGLRAGLDVDQARALGFVGLVTTNFGLIFLNRSFGASLLMALRRPNAALWRMLAVTVVTLGTILALPGARTLFRFSLPPPEGLLLALVCGAVVLVALEGVKALLPRCGGR